MQSCWKVTEAGRSDTTDSRTKTAFRHLTLWVRVLLEKLTVSQLVKKLPSISRKLKLHYLVHHSLAFVPVLGQTNPVHKPPSYFVNIRFNISSLLCFGLTSFLLLHPSPSQFHTHFPPDMFIATGYGLDGPGVAFR